MIRIALTGAGGNGGREVRGAFDDDDHVVVLFIHPGDEDRDSKTLDIHRPRRTQ